MMKEKKIKKGTCKDKKELSKAIQEFGSDAEEFERIVAAKKEQKKPKELPPLVFSPMLQDKSLKISNYEATVDSSLYRQGQVTLSRKLEEKTSWRLKMCGISLAVQFGICKVIEKDGKKTIDETFGLYSQGYGPNKHPNGYEFTNNEWIRIEYDPEDNTCSFYNEQTKRTYAIEVDAREQGFDYYPYVFLYKATVYLEYEPDLEEDMYEGMYEALYAEEIAQENAKRAQQEEQEANEMEPKNDNDKKENQ